MDAWQEKKVPERNYLGDKLSDDTRADYRIFKDDNDK